MAITWAEKQAAIESLESGGKVDPVALVDAARDPSHPCHGDFTWDIERAANERWRDQARALIRRCKFEVIVHEVKMPVVRYVGSPDDEPIFISVPKIRSVAKAGAVMDRELRMLYGNAARVYGIAVAKSGSIDAETIAALQRVRDELAVLVEGLG